VINDGSCSENSVFQQIVALKNQKNQILTHSSNLGKGAALKTAFNFILASGSKVDYAVTVDSDGQHQVKDILKLIACCEHSNAQLVLGVRNLNFRETPLRSYLGNKISRIVFFLFTGVPLKDTQTGLRAYHHTILSEMLKIKSNRYEFEMNVILKCVHNRNHLEQVSIDTRYLDRNSSSHFNPLVDSIKIYLSLISYFLKKIF
jgi:hypothetical protein